MEAVRQERDRDRRALIIVDVQNDFCPGGALAVDGGDRVAGDVSDWVASRADDYVLVVATMDWHPSHQQAPGFDHFADEPDFVDTWPPHCVQGTPGARFHAELALPDDVVVVRKGQSSAAYSGFEGVDDAGRSLAAILEAAGIEAVDVVGLATDYCVRATALDAVELGLSVRVLTDLTAGVAAESSRQALDAMAGAGISLDAGFGGPR